MNFFIHLLSVQGHDITTGLMELPRTQDTLNHILFAINRVRPDLRPNLFYLPEVMSAGSSSVKHVSVAEETSYPVEKHVLSVPVRSFEYVQF